MKSIKNYAVALVVLATVSFLLGLTGCKKEPKLEKQICCIQVSGEFKDTYYVGEEFDSTGMIVKLHYKDNSFKEIKDYTLSGFDSSEPGEGKMVTVSYKTVSTFITVKITVKDEESKIKYGRIDENYVSIKGGEIVGSTNNQCWNDESYPGVFIEGRTVTLSDFIMCDHEVTKAEYIAIMSDSTLNTAGITADPSYSTNQPTKYVIADGEDSNKQPIENVNWYSAVYYCNLLSQKEGLDCVYTITNLTTKTITMSGAGISGTESITIKYISGATVTADHTKNGYRLPTEAEWEYAARGGNPSVDAWRYEYSGSDSTTELSDPVYDPGLDSVGWYKNNICNSGVTSSEEGKEGTKGYATHQVKLKAANSLDLYDMSGNVYEWCYDWKEDNISTGSVTDPIGATSGSKRACRGGSNFNNVYFCCVGYCVGATPDKSIRTIGFRVARSRR